jgi:O-antigen biosynthesis protein
MQSNENKDAEARDVVKLKAKTNLLLALLSHSQDELQNRDSKISQLEAKISQLEAKISQLEAKISQLAARLQQEEETIAEIMQSTSWRLTAPLRALKRAARGARLRA